MKLKLKQVFSILFLSTALIACGGGEVAVESPPAITEETQVDVDSSATEEPIVTEAPTEKVAQEAIQEPTATNEPVAEAEPAAETTQEQALPLYLSSELVDVNSSQPFRIADLTGQGKYVLVEMMAVW